MKRVFSEEHRKKLSEARKGKKHTEETKQKIGKSNLGKKHSEEAKEKMQIAKLGKKLTEEHKNKISKRLSKKVFCEETNKIYDSLTQASKELNLFIGNISKVCKGILIQTGGLHFRYCIKKKTRI